ncbi:hypothetical protein ABE24_03365 [Cytobacillus firmus]|nr:hypothetical protein [Cytobacillus firmus]
MTHILPKAVAFGRAMFMLTKPYLSCGPQAQVEPLRKALFAFLGGLACDLEGVGAEAGQLSRKKFYILLLNKPFY